MAEYNHSKIEGKWQKVWDKNKAFKADDKSKKPKFFGLIEFPFPNGEGLHVGHVRSNTAMDIIARKRRREGFNVLYPIGWDAFGLPTENYAIKTGIHPAIVTKKNTDNFRRQLKAIGYSFDWDREVNTSDPKYYKWTQWIFLEMFKRGLAYQAKTEVWWCEALGTVLANEEVTADEKSERGEHPCVKMQLSQWMLAITKYADRLYDDLDTVDYLEKIKSQQKNWIGRSEGAELSFRIKAAGIKLDDMKVFTTRPDTIYGVTYVVVAPEHTLISKIKAENARLVKNWSEVEEYVALSRKKTNIERSTENIDKTGVELKGVRAINPANGEEVPVWVADYVLADYGTGAVMAVPAHDERDFEFAKKFNLQIKEVIKSSEKNQAVIENKLFTDYGILINSGRWDGLESESIKKQITESVGGAWVSKFKLRDWVFSRQRYWGEPFPIVWVSKEAYELAKSFKDSIVSKQLPQSPVIKTISEATFYALPIPNKFLPVELPKVKSFAPTGDGKSALGKASKWVNVWFNVKTGETTSVKKKTGGNWVVATRETDTMPNWAGSSWYYLRYADPKNDKELGSKTKLSKWLPVDWYNGGMEHTTLHVLYSRFWHKFLYDIKVVPTPEPYTKRTSHGMILGEGGVKMSKSLGNVINPDGIVKTYGADTLRIYEMFMGPFDQHVAWSTESIIGSRRFIERVWKLQSKVDTSNKTLNNSLSVTVQKTIKKVSDDIEKMQFNTAISSMMILVNEMDKAPVISKESYMSLIQLLAPFAPHVTEELWSIFKAKGSIHEWSWPVADESVLSNQTTTLVVQVMGKVRATIQVDNNVTESDIVARAKAHPDVVKWVEGKEIIKVIYVPGKIVNIVVKG